MESVFVHLGPALAPAVVDIQWDEDGHAVLCRVQYPPNPTPEPSYPLQETLDHQFGIGKPSYGVTLDREYLTLDAERRLVAFDAFSYAEHWRIQALPAISAQLGVPTIDATFDENGRAGENLAPEAFYDPASATLCLWWGEAQQWGRVADNLLLGMADDGRLMQIRVYGLYVPEAGRSAQPQQAGWWGRVKQKLGLA